MMNLAALFTDFDRQPTAEDLTKAARELIQNSRGDMPALADIRQQLRPNDITEQRARRAEEARRAREETLRERTGRTGRSSLDDDIAIAAERGANELVLERLGRRLLSSGLVLDWAADDFAAKEA
jgi:hypothetical protein